MESLSITNGVKGFLHQDVQQFISIQASKAYVELKRSVTKSMTLLLIGIDGGATFFNSILKDLLNGLQESSTQDVKIRKRPQKAYLYWITSEQGSFTNLFKDVVDDIAQYDSNNVITICNYLTKVYKERDARSVLIEMIQSMQYAKNRIDVISESQIRTHFARPKWYRVVVNHILSENKSQRIGVYCCGRRQEMKSLRKHCRYFDLNTTFHFLKESL